MKKNLIMLLSVLIFGLVGCSNNETGLEGKTLGISSFDPTVTEEEKENADIKFTPNMLVFDFTSADEVTLMQSGNEYSGDYTLEESNLSVNLEDDGATLRLDFVEFEETPDEYYSYTGKIENGELDDSDGSSQLSNIVDDFGMGETYMFLEEN